MNTRYLYIKQNRAAALILAVLFLHFGGDVLGAEAKVEPLKPGDFTPDGIFCTFFLPKPAPGKIQKVAERDYSNDTLVVRVDGEVQRLSLKSEAWTPTRPDELYRSTKIGDQCEQVWANSDTRVVLTYRVVKCDYEYFGFAGQMLVESKGLTRTIQVEGETGS